VNFFARLFKPPARRPVMWLSIYRDPRPAYDRQQYLCKDPSGDGYFYSPYKDEAFRFSSRAEAEAVTPVYDGSSNIASRAGVIPE